MNIQALMKELGALQKEWALEARLATRFWGKGHRWIDGVAYGVALTVRAVRAHVQRTRRPRT